MTIFVNAKHIVDSSGDHSVLFIHYIVMQSVKPYDRIDFIQTAVAPYLKLRQNSICYGTYSLGRYGCANCLFKPTADVPSACSKGLQTDNTVCHTLGQHSFSLFDELGIE